MTGSQLLVRALELEGVDVLFGYPGGAIMPVYDALYDSKLRHVLVRHEQAAALAADGYARVTGKVGVCISTSGPGATNLITGIANACMDSVPLVAITGQVPTGLMGTDAFQEVDIMGITFPVVKHSFLVRRSEDLPRTVREAFRLARSGRPGPVLIDLPKDVASGAADAVVPAESLSEGEPRRPDPAKLQQAMELLKGAGKPLIYAGGGIGIGGAIAEFRRFVETTQIPVVATLKGLGALPTDHQLFLGMMGMHGTQAANTAVQATDLLISIGARFDDRATGKLSTFAPEAKVVHMDVDRAELGKLRRPDVGLLGDLRPALKALAFPIEIRAWREECLALKEKYRWRYDVPTKRVYGPRFLKTLSEEMDENTIIACDVGQHQMWVAQHCRFDRPDRHLTSGGLGAMGYGLPASIGAHFGRPGSTIINVTGDGSFMMNLQELATVRRYRVPVKIVVLDNQRLGLVRQWQELFFERRYSEVDLSDNPDFVQVAASFGIPGFRAEGRGDEESALRRLLHEPGPQLLHVRIDEEANVWPLVPPNQSNSEMLMGVHK